MLFAVQVFSLPFLMLLSGLMVWRRRGRLLIIPMTPLRTTLLLAVIFVVLGVYVYTIEVPTMEQDARQETEAQRLLPFDYRDVTHLAYTTRTERILMSRDERNRWRIVEPVETRGDAREIESVLRALEIGKISRIIHKKGKEQDATANNTGCNLPTSPSS